MRFRVALVVRLLLESGEDKANLMAVRMHFLVVRFDRLLVVLKAVEDALYVPLYTRQSSIDFSAKPGDILTHGGSGLGVLLEALLDTIHPCLETCDFSFQFFFFPRRHYSPHAN